MNICDYFVVFYVKNNPIDSFNFSYFSDDHYYICPCIKNGKYICFNVYSYDDHIYQFDIAQHDYYVYWPKSLSKLYNRLVFHRNIKSPSLSPFRRYSKYFSKTYSHWQIKLKHFATPLYEEDYQCFSIDKFRNRFKAITVMK